MATKVAVLGDGLLVGFEARARSIARDIESWGAQYVLFNGDASYGTVDADGGMTASWTEHAKAYGTTAPAQSPAGADLSLKTAIIPGNHEYFSGTGANNATTFRPDATDTYLQGLKTAGGIQQLDTTKTDATAAYTGFSSGDAQKIAAVQWSHLQVHTIEGWLFLGVDVYTNPTDQAIYSDPVGFPTGGDYYDAVANLVAGIKRRRLVVWVHAPRYTSGSSHVEGSQASIQPLWDLVAQSCTLFLGAHNHHFERQTPRDQPGRVIGNQRIGTTSITIGNCGGALNGFNGGYATPTAVVFQDSTNFGYGRVTVSDLDNLRVDLTSLGTDGLQTPTVVDSVSLKAGPQPYIKFTVSDFSGSLQIPTTVDTTDRLCLIIASSDPTNSSPTSVSPGTWPLKRAQSGQDSYIYVHERQVVSGDAGSTITWTALAESKGTLIVVGDSAGIWAITGSTYVTVDSTERNTGSLQADVDTTATAYFMCDSSQDPLLNNAGGDNRSVGGAADFPDGAWSEVHEDIVKATTRWIVVQVQAAVVADGVTVQASGAPPGIGVGVGNQESGQILILWAPLPVLNTDFSRFPKAKLRKAQPWH